MTEMDVKWEAFMEGLNKVKEQVRDRRWHVELAAVARAAAAHTYIACVH